ncbi:MULTISPECIES: tyrosine-type recombinase/integrase [Bacillus]|uniref:tyrosine-type recombinase/integrase n=1 Tax=Bacillus TaxID=1386 RepID=UPI0002D6BE91|nr:MULTISPECIES: tyrosine-type recombinase/integrase [Bacillus]
MRRYWNLKKVLPNQKNQEVIQEFLTHLKLANRTEGTIIVYRRFLEDFFGEVEESYDKLSSNQIIGWFHANKKHLKDTSFKGKLNILSSFYSFCVQESLMERSPIKRRWFPRLTKTIPKALGKEEIAKVIREAERRPLRDQAIVEFLLTSGCRIGELHLLNIGDLDLENRTARVRGKGKKIRMVHFSEKCLILLERYLETRLDINDSSPLFINSVENRIGIRSYFTIIATIGKLAGLSSNLHPHRFRHTFATELLSKGADLSFISEELGHADLKTTQVYARVLNQSILAQYRKFMG